MVRPSSSSTSSAEKERDAFSSTLSSAFASMMAVGAPHHSHNPFTIGPLRIDDASSRRSTRKESGSTKVDDERSQKKSNRLSGFRKGGRSLSPFRLGSHKRSSSATRLKINPDEDTESEYTRSERDKDSDNESIVSSASGIIPRNSAFHSHDDEEYARSGPSHTRRPTGQTSPGVESIASSMTPSASANSLSYPNHPADDADADVESIASDVSDDEGRPSTVDQEDEEDDENDIDPVVLDNTLYNAECLTAHEHWATDPKSDDGHHHFETYEDEDLERDDEHITAPNVVLAEDQVNPFLQRRGSKMLSLTVSRPRFERNRCTITLSHGDYEAAAKTSKRPKRYVVASDGSEESSYAVEWTIGTVLRDGDEMLVVSVMETDTKLDALDPKHEEVSARLEHQRIRQAMASVLAKQATHLLERTRLEVKISCQAIHAKNSRHMILDLIDFYEPTMVVVGSRGLGSLKGILLGSTSHYLVQKSSAPVMVARKRLKLPALPRGKGDVVESVRARHMRLDQASIEKVSNAAEEEAAEAQAKELDGRADDSTPSDEMGVELESKMSASASNARQEAEGQASMDNALKTGKEGSAADPSKEDSPKLQRKPSKSASTKGPATMLQTSLEREAETRSEIQQRKLESAKLHEEEKKKHHGQVKLRSSEQQQPREGNLESEQNVEGTDQKEDSRGRSNSSKRGPG